MPEIRSCRVSYQDQEGIRHSVEVTAETLYEAAVLGMKALQVERNAPTLTIDVTVKAPETTHTIRTAALSEWLSRTGKSPGSRRSITAAGIAGAVGSGPRGVLES
jgi:hypothetical protein